MLSLVKVKSIQVSTLQLKLVKTRRGVSIAFLIYFFSENIQPHNTNNFDVGLPCTRHYLDDLENFTSFLNKRIFLPDRGSEYKESSKKSNKDTITEQVLKTQLAQPCQGIKNNKQNNFDEIP